MRLLWIELIVVGAISAAFLISTLFFKAEHVEHHPSRVRKGALIQGLILGALIGFVLLPLRFAFFVPDASLVPDAPPPPPKEWATLALIPFFVMMIIVRRGLLARAPVIGKYIRAYRRALLKFQIDGAQKALTRLEAMDEKRKATI